MKTETVQKQILPITFISISTIAWSLIPLSLELSGAGGSPVAFFVLFAFGTSLGLLIYLLATNRNYIKKTEFSKFREVVKGTHSELSKSKVKDYLDKHIFIILLIGRFGVLLYAWSTSQTNTAIAAVIFESWVIWFILLRDFNNRKEKNIDNNHFNINRQQLGARSYTLLVFAIFGLWYVNISDTGTQNGEFGYGTILAVLGSILAAVSVERSLKFGQMAREYNDKVSTENYLESEKNSIIKEQNEREFVFAIFAVAAASFIAGLIALPIILFQYLLSGNNFSTVVSFNGALWTISIALISNTIMIIFGRKANIITKSPEINSIQYLTPAISLIWLLIFTNISIQRIDLFIIGSVIVIAINLMINIPYEEKKLGLFSLILSIWGAGIIVLYRDHWLGEWLGSKWLWSGTTDYFALLALSTTVFVLILSFRTIRVLDRTKSEEVSAFKLKNLIESLDIPSSSKKRGFDAIKTIDSHKPGIEMDKAYIEIKGILSECQNISAFERAELLGEFDFLEYSKRQGRDTIELIVLFVFSVITITLALTSRPNFEIWNGFIFDSFTIIFSAAIIFLSANLIDQRVDRGKSIFERSDIKFSAWRDYVRPVLLCCIVAISFGILLYGKWIIPGEWQWTCDIFPNSSIPEKCK